MGYRGRNVKLSDHIQLLLRLRTRGAISQFPTRLHVMVLNYPQLELCTGRGPVAGCYERGDEISGYKQGWKIFLSS